MTAAGSATKATVSTANDGGNPDLPDGSSPSSVDPDWIAAPEAR